MALVAAAAGYLLGAIPFIWLLGRLLGVDLRTVGSGNVGAANLAEARGRWTGALGLLLDAAKGAAAPLLAERWGPGAAAAAGIGAVIGHGWPMWLGFAGGRSQAVALAAGGVITPWATLAILPILGVGYFSARLAVSWLVALVLWPVAAGLSDGAEAVGYTLAVAVLTVILRLRGSPRLVPRVPLAMAWRERLLYDREP